MFPELAFTGYIFKNQEDIKPYCEEQKQGQQYKFLSQLAKRLFSYVFAGYPEIQIQSDNSQKYYNSAYLIDRDGNLIINYRKKHLFESDKTWAQEGQEFKCVELLNLENKTFKAGLGICMDINPYEFLNCQQFELSDFCKEQQIDVLLFLSAWNDHEPNRNDRNSIEGQLNYWLWRLRTIINQKKEINFNKTTFDCRNLEITEWLPMLSVCVVAKETGTVFNECDLSDLPWCDYDEKSEQTVQINVFGQLINRNNKLK
ncbi:carbon-nitrogen family protein, putative [Ichthyophthirius multifiliis]|uniref:Carbon-nitrogen family protein, putative n=1 Tax=Ichthyophthirius multifiliis TaxID=5932 RepID=G0QVS7_ICHMU|nr:carbon-nitrogen family protein, putative [Ichthyophthirius multifiliis]EGR30676.1 carbon-nitrogen family protein, putative [Ichthyophthirius multifiliis]|eukprot:XP_004032263.1 carbon-nitrogen family protein, putative [Ichthyophthirius multifiliis]